MTTIGIIFFVGGAIGCAVIASEWRCQCQDYPKTRHLIFFFTVTITLFGVSIMGHKRNKSSLQTATVQSFIDYKPVPYRDMFWISNLEGCNAKHWRESPFIVDSATTCKMNPAELARIVRDELRLIRVPVGYAVKVIPPTGEQ